MVIGRRNLMIPGRGGEPLPTDAVQTVAGVVETEEMREAVTDDHVRRWEDHTRALRLYFLPYAGTAVRRGPVVGVGLSTMSLDPKLLDVLACPKDKGQLTYLEEEQVLVNERLGIAYRIEDGIPVMLIDEAIEYVPGVEYDLMGTNWKFDRNTGIRDAVRAARRSDVIIACIGENTYCETPGNDVDMNLSDNQKELVTSLAATGRPIILILNGGRPRIINDIESMATAVVDILLPGNYGGDALAALLSGEENFSGRLPFTYPKYVNKFAVYDYKHSESQGMMSGSYNYNAVMDIQWPFGHGMSYTAFEYSNLTVSAQEFGADDVLKVTVDVTNVGAREGKESVLLYSSDLYASSTPDVRRLRAFDKVSLQPGEIPPVEFELPAKDLAFVDYYGKWRLEEGDFILSVGNLSQKLTCTETVLFEQPNID